MSSHRKSERKIRNKVSGWNEAIFHPWFLPRKAYRTIVQAVPREYLMKMRDYFDRYGCMRCNRSIAAYGSNGMCSTCVSNISRKLRRCVKRRFGALKKPAVEPHLQHYLASAKTAREILRDLRPVILGSRAEQQKYRAQNPARGILGHMKRD
jgi:hypothetical protein